MKRKVKLFYGVFALFVLFLAVLDLTDVFRSSGGAAKIDEINHFAVKILSSSLNSDGIIVEYQLFNAAEESKIIPINYRILSVTNEPLGEGSGEVIFDPNSDNRYKMIISSDATSAILEASISAFNGFVSASDSVVVAQNTRITGITISEEKREISTFVMGILLLIAILFVSRKVRTHYKQMRKLSRVHKGLIQIKHH